jgi:F5/8 type C domain
MLAAVTLMAVTGVSQGATSLHHELLDDFRNAGVWQASASDQVKAALRADASDGSLCLDYDFGGVSGYAVMRRELPVEWPQHFELKLRFKGAGAVNDLQMKLVDASGDNVWWINRPGFVLPKQLTEMKLRRRHIDFAWGPTADRTLRQTRVVEFVIAAGQNEGSGGRGTLCVARLELNERAPDPTPWPEPQRNVRGGTLDLDFLHAREFNGVTLRWPAGAPRALDYSLLASDDGRRWKRLRTITGSDGGLDTIWLPESEARHLRVQTRGAKPTTRPALELRDAAQWPDFNASLAELARDARAGDLPRAFLGQQNYWALVGVDGGGERSALLSEDGAIEIGRGGVSVEPAVQIDGGAPLTWTDVEPTQSLRDGYLPLPAVHWRHETFTLDIEAAADGERNAPQALARYTLTNSTDKPRRFTLLLGVRPWQVNPPQQFLTTPGGSSPVRELAWADGVLAVNGRRLLQPTEPPRTVSAAPFDAGLSLDVLRNAPPLTTLQDPQSHASALLQFEFTLQAGERRTIGWTAPLARKATQADSIDTATLDARFDNIATRWRERLNHTTLMLPADAQPIADTLRSTLAQILISRDGAALKPGTRSYARTWVRDGAMMVAALLRLGEVDASREFVDWFAGFIFDSGKVPCCVDARGADPVAENDSHGQYLYAVAEVWRHTQDRAWLARHWPIVQRVLAYQEGLRQSERGARNRERGREHLFGLMPPSISHEGYSDKAAYAYWDDFWALRGYKDATQIARVLGHEIEAQRWSAWTESFERELGASIAATAVHHRIGFIPGAADRGDFDPTSTTIALNPVQAELPPALQGATFERYWRESLARAEGKREWKDYTPYELRSVGALARMGQAARAHAMLDFFMRDRRPAAWNQWAEVVRPGYRERGFFGDLPHAWVASDYIRSALDLFAYEREADASIVVGAGWKPEWLTHGLEVRGLSTAFGVLDYKLERASDGWRFTLARGLPEARGGVQLRWPGEGPLPLAQAGGRELTWNARTLALPPTAGTLVLIQR